MGGTGRKPQRQGCCDRHSVRHVAALELRRHVRSHHAGLLGHAHGAVDEDDAGPPRADGNRNGHAVYRRCRRGYPRSALGLADDGSSGDLPPGVRARRIVPSVRSEPCLRLSSTRRSSRNANLAKATSLSLQTRLYSIRHLAASRPTSVSSDRETARRKRQSSGSRSPLRRTPATRRKGLGGSLRNRDGLKDVTIRRGKKNDRRR